MNWEKLNVQLEEMETQLNCWKCMPSDAGFTEANFYDLMFVYGSILDIFKTIQQLLIESNPPEK